MAYVSDDNLEVCGKEISLITRTNTVKDVRRFDLSAWKGQNLLGYALMEVRQDFALN